MNRILATIAFGLLLAWGAGKTALAQEGQPAQTTKSDSATKSESATKAESATKGEPAANSEDQAPGEPKAKSADEPKATSAPEQVAPPPGVIRPLGVAPTAEAGGESEASAGEHGAGAHGHDTDLSHGDASPALHQPQEWRFDLSIFTFVVFGLLVAILTKFAWGPIVAGLEKREQTIAKQIADAEHASAMAAKQLQEYERKLAAATEEARAIVGQARQDAISAKDKIVAEAQAAAGKERDKAVADITSAKNLALQEIAEKSVSTAISLASNIIRREVKAEDHDKLINESLQKLSSLN
jgi:ATP synthase, F0 subunit b